MTQLLFADSLENLNADSLLRTESSPLLRAREMATLTAAPPTNQQILDAARKAYHANAAAVDASAQSGVQYALSASGHPNVAALNAFNWKNRQPGPITPTAHQILTSAAMVPAVDAAKSNGSVYSMTIGITESAQFIIGEEGGIGIAFALNNSGNVKGMGFVAGKLGLDIDVGINLQVGLWNCAPEALAGTFYGLEVAVDLEAAVTLGIYTTPKLDAFGFALGVGVGLGGGVSVVGGHTWIF